MSINIYKDQMQYAELFGNSDKKITGVEGTKVEPANYKGVDVNIGDTVEFTLTAALPSNYDEYTEFMLKFKDVLSKGLKFEGISSVTVIRDMDTVVAAIPEFEGGSVGYVTEIGDSY